MNPKYLYQKVINYLRPRLSRMQFMMLVAVLVGLVSGLIAVLLKTLVHLLRHWMLDIPVSKFTFLLFPAFGLLITVYIIRRFFEGRIERGIAMVLRSIARKSSFIPGIPIYMWLPVRLPLVLADHAD